MQDGEAIDGTGSRTDAIGGDRPSASQEGKRGAPVTADDLALREDICYQIFGDVGSLIRDFSCAWDHKVLMHGRMYVTERRLCFYANFFGLEAKMSLRHEDVARCMKGNSAIFIPNAIVVQDKSGKDFVFRNFWERDECHGLLEKLRVEAEEAEDVLEAAAAAEGEVGDDGEEVEGDGDSSSHGDARDGPDPSDHLALPLSQRARATTVSAFPTVQWIGNGSFSERSRRLHLSHSDDAISSSVLASTHQTHSTTALAESISPSPESPLRARSMSMRAPHTTVSDAASATAVPTASVNGTPKSSAAAAAAAAAGVDRRPTGLGLAVVGAEHDVPSSPRAAYGSRRFQHLQRSQSSGKRSPDSSRHGNGEGGRTRARADVAGGRREGAGDGASRRHVRGGGEGSRGEIAEGDRRGSRLWKMMRWDDGRGGEGDLKADREAMEEAVSAGGDQAKVATAKLPVSVTEFYERFFADGAPYGLPDFHMSRGDWEVQAGEWQETEDDDESASLESARDVGDKDRAKKGHDNGHSNGKSKGSSNVNGRGDDKAGEEGRGEGKGSGGLTRAIRFKTPLHITFMSSPGQVRTLKHQRVRFFGGAGCIVDTITSVEDRIPLSDNFHVEDRWIIRPAGKDGRACSATVTWRCVWHKFTVIKGLIEGKAREDVRSFNVAFLEGMRAHLKEKTGRRLKRRPSLRESLLSAAAGGRRGRDGSPSGREGPPFDPVESAESDIAVEGKIGINVAGLMTRYLPTIRVLSICFVAYLMMFWVFHQMRPGGYYGVGGGAGLGGGQAAKGGVEDSKEELMRLYAEWGRSSLALLDVRAEALRLSSEVAQLRLYGAGGLGRGGPVRDEGSEAWKGDKAALQALRDMEEKMMGISELTEQALVALDSAAAQIREAQLECTRAREKAGDGDAS